MFNDKKNNLIMILIILTFIFNIIITKKIVTDNNINDKNVTSSISKEDIVSIIEKNISENMIKDKKEILKNIYSLNEEIRKIKDNKIDLSEIKKDILNLSTLSLEDISNQIKSINPNNNEKLNEVVLTNIASLNNEIKLLGLKIEYINESISSSSKNDKKKKSIRKQTKTKNSSPQVPVFYVQGVMTGDKNIAFISESKNSDPYSVSVGDMVNGWVITKITKEGLEIKNDKTNDTKWFAKGK